MSILVMEADPTDMSRLEEPRAKDGPIRLDFRKANTPVLVRAADSDAFVVTMAQAVSACRQVEHATQWKRSFDAFLAHLHRWSVDNRATVASTFVAPSANGLDVYLVTHGDNHRPEFDDATTRLDIELSKQFPNCPSHVMHLPDEGVESLASFFDPATALQVYG